METVSRVTRSKAQAKASYDRMSRFYDFFSGAYEKKTAEMALNRLDILPGETVLEIGFGTGHSLLQMARLVGEQGQVFGIDISEGMLEVSRRRLMKAGLWSHVELSCEDATQLPYTDDKFDAVFCSYTLELFDTPEILLVLGEVRRVLKPDGRVGMVSLSKEGGLPWMVRLYEWLHCKLPQFFDCRPIYLERSLCEAGLVVEHSEVVSLAGLPVEIVIASKLSSA